MRRFIVSLLILAFAIGAPLPSYAGYAQLKPPPGWSTGMGSAVPGTSGLFNFGKAANDAKVVGGTVLTNAALNVGGKMITVPVALRTAANSAQFAATWSFGNPWVFGTLAVGSAAYNWFVESGLSVKEGVWVKSDPSVCSLPPCSEYSVTTDGGSSLWFPTAMLAATAFLARHAAAQPTYRFEFIDITGSSVRYAIYRGATLIQWAASEAILTRSTAPHDPAFVPIGDPEFHQKLDPKAIPDAMPQQMPGVDWPVEVPIFNPDPAIAPQPRPAPAPLPRPLWEPLGDPVKNPNPDRNPDGSPKTNPDGSPIANPKPDTWTQPGVRVQPSPTPDSPWQVDVNPENITKTDPNATPQTSGAPSPNATPKPATDAITCGLPGTPPCKIDEAGTLEPVKDDEYSKKIDNFKKKQDELRDKVAGVADKTFFAGWTAAFITPPLAQCQPFVLPRDMGALDPCPVVDGVRSVMAYIWAIGALWLSLGMIRRVI